MFFLFFAYSNCYTFGSGIKELNSKNWYTEIQQRSNLTVYVVMFHGQHCPACQMAYPNFVEAAKSATSTIKFGEVDTSREYNLASQFQIRGIPTFIVFHPNGESPYNGDRSARSFLNSAYKYVPNLAETVDETWTEMNKTVILFSDKKTVPPLWKAVSCHFHNKSVKIGFSDDEKIRALFKITAVPTILMTHNDTHYVYNGKNSFPEIRKGVVDFFNGKIKPPAPKTPIPVVISPLEDEEQFANICKGKGSYCVIIGAEEASATFREVARRYRNDPFKFLTCGEKCPIEYAKKGFIIVHPKREAAIRINEEGELRAGLDRVIGGDARFTPISKLTENEL
ncbi:Thioredoxin family protein [Tritrichomonas foetus]|uniref:Thioredoxin family protein n=1 Tax=Tritrichomonas foetus TaxID=1144522 RepID=A0A1J4KT09_9EUKA|nr:Thioredoxin family protein [Tritrichomonas foetus]|eukprot:OHT12621.1 Thioredoxin family protein [Tritrichomonas foetus]